ncbi:MAG: VOC family protein [Paracoccus sp. (in: a-proteobacteria)]|uniref:VOC family protein n=1 Tax=Paracoccus sp. TaxID=267 RepID=UPI0026E006A6|nr:VOC family protein [Paracoccus sp. (in: a-proteobacteria)]MDO5632435.1 VOC family protein [Paracoccus sp. (in: a-proteobacteria)]
MLTVDAVDHLVINVTNVEASAAWYARVLGMKRVDNPASGGHIRTSMMFGQSKINLRPADFSQDLWFTGLVPAPGSDDICFLTQSTPDEVVRHFQDCGVEIVEGPTDKSGALGRLCSVYIRDPDGNLIEVSSYIDC